MDMDHRTTSDPIDRTSSLKSVLESEHRYALLMQMTKDGRLFSAIPELESIDSCKQNHMATIYAPHTVLHHSILVCRYLTFYPGCPVSPFDLGLFGLTHDIGKSIDYVRHIEVGYTIFTEILKRFNVSKPVQTHLINLYTQHLLLGNITTGIFGYRGKTLHTESHDGLQSIYTETFFTPQRILELCGSYETFRLLMAFTEADCKAVNPAFWESQFLEGKRKSEILDIIDSDVRSLC